MLNYYHSNSLHQLLHVLAESIENQPRSSPFLKEVIVTSGAGMARWINLNLARQLGIAANVEYPLPARYIWSLAHDLLPGVPEHDPLSRDCAAWKIFFLLPGLLEEKSFESINEYLSSEESEVRLWSLAQRIGDVFDRYQYYRPELVRQWSSGGGEDWEPLLWRQLLADGTVHRVQIIDHLLNALQNPVGHDLPERISLFSTNDMPPLLMEVYQALSSRTRVDIYQLSPTPEYWADLASHKELARKRLVDPQAVEYWEVGNSLLTAWGKQGQMMLDTLLNGSAEIHQSDLGHEPSENTLLGSIQQDIYQLREPVEEGGRTNISPDDSLQVHVCHSPMRECQVLQDALLDYLRDPDLEPEDILVLVPEISKYAPYIESVFHQGTDKSQPFIPWNISDISVADEHPLVRIFLQLLSLPESRFERSEILSYLDVEEIASRFGMENRVVAQVRHWFDKLNLYWGLDGKHKRHFGLPETEQNTWRQLEKRLFSGYALGNDDFADGVVPVAGIEESEAKVLGLLWRFLDRLRETAQQLVTKRTPGEWQEILNGVLDDFFLERDQDGKVQQIRIALSELVDSTGDADREITLSLVRYWLQQRLANTAGRNSYYSGGVTFCGMQPMRSVPFKVICVLGMNDQAYPRRDEHAEFDRMFQETRHGDPRKQDADRYLLLESLVSAEQKFYISYTGRDFRTNDELQPSLLVTELLSYVDRNYTSPGPGDKAASPSRTITREHPMQAFSAGNYIPGSASYNTYWCDIAKMLLQPPGEPVEEDWHAPELVAPDEELREISLQNLIRFMGHPIRYFFNARLNLYLREEEEPEDTEPFFIDSLAAWSIKQRMVHAHLAQEQLSKAQLEGEGALPHGTLGGIAFEQMKEESDPLVSSLESYTGIELSRTAIDLQLETESGQFRLHGQVDNIYGEQGLLHFSSGKFKGDRVLALWIEYLAWVGSSSDGSECCARLVCSDKSLTFSGKMKSGQAMEELGKLCQLYWQGLHAPLPLFPRASFNQVIGSDSKARSAWNGSSYAGIGGDRDDPYIDLVMRGVWGDPLSSEAFRQLAVQVYEPVLEAGEMS